MAWRPVRLRDRDNCFAKNVCKEKLGRLREYGIRVDDGIEKGVGDLKCPGLLQSSSIYY